MRRAKSIHHENITQSRHALCQRLVIGLLAHVEAHVFQQAYFAGQRLHAIEPVPDEPHLACRSAPPARSATGARLADASNWPSLGRPRCDITIRRAPASRAACRVGSAARIRASLCTTPFSTGTFRSSRISTRFPRKLEVSHLQALSYSPSRQRALIMASVVSSMRLEKPHSLSYHEHTFTMRLLMMRVSEES